MLSFFKLALWLSKLQTWDEKIGLWSFKLIWLEYFAKLDGAFMGNNVFLINTIDPNFKFFISKIETGSSNNSLSSNIILFE